MAPLALYFGIGGQYNVKLYILEVRAEGFGGEEIDFRFRIFPGIIGQARFVGATVREELLLRPAGLVGDLRQKAT